MEITLEVPESLGRELQQRQSQLIEILERGIESVMAQESFSYNDATSVLELLVSQPEPAQVLAVRPSPELQTKVSKLLQAGKEGQLSSQEEAELNRYLLLEHLVRLAKAHAMKKLTPTS